MIGPQPPVAPRRAFLVAAVQALRSDGARQPEADPRPTPSLGDNRPLQGQLRTAKVRGLPIFAAVAPMAGSVKVSTIGCFGEGPVGVSNNGVLDD